MTLGKLATRSLVILFLSMLPSLAQEPPAQESSAPTLKVYSREIVVDVLVSDAHGNPVRGLKQSDFTISEDGSPQPLRSFAEYGFDDQPPPPLPPRLPPNVYTNFQAIPATGPVNILLIDALHSTPVEIVHSLKAADQYIHSMPAGTQLAVFWLAESGLHMLQGFTTDPALLRRAVETNRVDIGDTGDDAYTIAKLTLQALNQIAAYVAPIKGRKNLLWFVPDAPLLLLRDGGYGWGLFHDAPDMTLVHHVMDTYELFTTEQIAVSPIDTAGVHYLIPSQQMHLMEAEAIAQESGGEAFYENNDFKALITQAIHDGSHFYTLSYIPPRPEEDGHYHTIKIESTLPGLHLVYRAGYNSEDPKQLPQYSGAGLVKAAMEGNAPVATQLLFDVQAAPSSAPAPSSATPPASKNSVPYDIRYLIPQSQLAFATTPDGIRTLAVEFNLNAYDIYGRLAASRNETLKLPLSPAKYQAFLRTPLQFAQHLDLPPGQITLRIGILDTTSNKVGTLEVPLTVTRSTGKHSPEPPASTATQCPPRCTLPATGTPH
jgi:VWFA-related protein